MSLYVGNIYSATARAETLYNTVHPHLETTLK